MQPNNQDWFPNDFHNQTQKNLVCYNVFLWIIKKLNQRHIINQMPLH